MSQILKQVERSLNIKPKAKAQEQDGLDGHMSQAIKAAVQPEVAAQVREALRDLPAQVREEVQQTASAQMDLLARKHARTQLEQQAPLGAPLAPLGDRQNVSAATVPDQHLKPAQPQAARPMPIITMSRGADGKIRSASVGRMTFNVERDSAGRAMRLVPED